MDEPTPPSPDSLAPEDYAAWRRAVLRDHEDRCGNCGASQNLGVELLVPLDRGGHLTAGNGAVLCRRCSFAQKNPPADGKQQLVSFYVSRDFYERLEKPTFNRAFRSRGELLRHLLEDWTEYPDRYADLDNYQDALPRGDTAKVSAWVPGSTYARFSNAARSRGKKISYVLKALLLLFEAQP